MPTTILIVGATGKQGGQALSSLLDSPNASDNLSLRFLTRNPTSATAQALAAKGAKAIKGDLNDRAALAEALNGVEWAFLVTDAMAGEEKETQQGVVFVDVAKEAGVKHLVFSSVCASDTATSVPHFRSKGKIEEYLKASGLSYTILRSVAFMDNFPSQPSLARTFVIGGFSAFTSQKPCEFIACKDIGVFAAKALLSPSDPDFNNTTINLSAGAYDLRSTRRAVESAQGYNPWIASYFMGVIRRVLPYDFRMMFEFFDTTGYPK